MLYNCDNCSSDQLYQDCQTKQASSTHTGVPSRYMLHKLNMQGLIDTDWETAIHISSVKSPFTLDKSGSPGFGCGYLGTCEYLLVLGEQHFSQESIHPIGLHVVNNRSTAPAAAPEASWVSPQISSHYYVNLKVYVNINH